MEKTLNNTKYDRFDETCDIKQGFLRMLNQKYFMIYGKYIFVYNLYGLWV